MIFKNLWVTALCINCIGMATAKAAVITVDVGFDLSLSSGNDAAGLDGASVLFTASFADGTTFVDPICCPPMAIAASHSFTISGASVAASNGVFSDPGGAAFSPNNGLNEGFFTQSGSVLSLAGLASVIQFGVNNQIPDVLAGDLLTVAMLDVMYGTTQFAGWLGTDGSQYSLTNINVNAFQGGVNEVPLPAAFPLFLMGISAIGFVGRKRSAPIRTLVCR